VNIGRAVRAGRWRKEKRTGQDRKKSQKGYISPIWGEAPTQAICIKNCVVGNLLDVIICAKFQNEIFRGYDFTGGYNQLHLFGAIHSLHSHTLCASCVQYSVDNRHTRMAIGAWEICNTQVSYHFQVYVYRNYIQPNLAQFLPNSAYSE